MIFLQQYNLEVVALSIILVQLLFAIAVSARQSSDLKWEETTTYNAGLDFDCTTIE
jgi:iron complex outermembrane receptor protein